MQRNALRCPECDYDLRRLGAADGAVRCPECGLVIPLNLLARHLVHRNRRMRAWHAEVTLALALGLGVFLSTVVFDFPLRTVLERRIAFLLTMPGFAIITMLTVVIWALSFVSLTSLLARERWTFALVAALLLILVPLPWGGLLAGVWISWFLIREFRPAT